MANWKSIEIEIDLSPQAFQLKIDWLRIVTLSLTNRFDIFHCPDDDDRDASPLRRDEIEWINNFYNTTHDIILHLVDSSRIDRIVQALHDVHLLSSNVH